MRGRIKLLPIFLILFLAFSCADDEYNEENDLNKKMVVQAYVYADEPINNVRVSKVHNQGEALSIPVNTASIAIIQGDERFELKAHPAESGLYIQEDTSEVPSSDLGEISMEIIYEGMTHISRTQMPRAINNLEISEDVMDVIPGDTSSVVGTITWDPIDEAPGYCIFIRHISEDAEPIASYMGDQASSNPFIIVNHSHEVELKGAHFSHFGTYEVYVTAVNSEYIDIYGNGYDNSLDMAPTNISSGWGVFTAFNGQTLTFTVQ